MLDAAATRRPCLLLEEDEEFAEAVPEGQRSRATAALRADTIALESGSWAPPPQGPDAFGLLVLDGLIAHRVVLGHSLGTELLGPGDLLRPCGGLPFSAVSTTSHWEVIQPATLALLDERVTALMCRWPSLSVAVSERALRRVHCATYLLAASNMTRVTDRLLATLWHIAGMWGRVTPEGIAVPFRLTQATLGQIVGARRPTVTLSLHQLQADGLVGRPASGRYVVLGDLPEWLDGARHQARNGAGPD